MDELFGQPPGGTPAEPETTEHIDPLLAQRVERRPWELQSAKWRAQFFAEMAFGAPVEVSLAGRPGYPEFRGLVYLSVPFRHLQDHTSRQALFLAWAGADPILGRVPLIYVFEPDPVAVP